MMLRMCGMVNTYSMVMGVKTCIATIEIRVAIPQKIHLSSRLAIPYLGTYQKIPMLGGWGREFTEGKTGKRITFEMQLNKITNKKV